MVPKQLRDKCVVIQCPVVLRVQYSTHVRFRDFPKKETLKKSWLTDSFLRLNDFVHLSIVSLLASGPRFIGPCFVWQSSLSENFRDFAAGKRLDRVKIPALFFKFILLTTSFMPWLGYIFDEMVTFPHDKLFPETRVKCRKMQKWNLGFLCCLFLSVMSQRVILRNSFDHIVLGRQNWPVTKSGKRNVPQIQSW